MTGTLTADVVVSLVVVVVVVCVVVVDDGGCVWVDAVDDNICEVDDNGCSVVCCEVDRSSVDIAVVLETVVFKREVADEVDCALLVVEGPFKENVK